MQTVRLRRIAPLAAVALVALAPLMLLAGPGLEGPHMRGPADGDEWRMLEHLTYRLELTDTQREQIHSIAQSRQADFEALHEQMQTARSSMLGTIHADTLDETAIREAAAAVSRVEADLAVARASLLREIRSVLTTAQLAEMSEMFAEMEAYHEDHPRGEQGMHPRHSRRHAGGGH